jgi:hypothetical protein
MGIIFKKQQLKAKINYIYSNVVLPSRITLLGKAGQTSAGTHTRASCELKTDGAGLSTSQSAGIVGGVLGSARGISQKTSVGTDCLAARLKRGAFQAVGGAAEGNSGTGTRRGHGRASAGRHSGF